MSKPGKQEDPARITVPFRATRVRETPSIAQWAYPLVWTARMLATLQSGVKGGVDPKESILYRTWACEPARYPSRFRPIPDGLQLTGEPYAGEPHVRF